jgi:hypothetical protein
MGGVPAGLGIPSITGTPAPCTRTLATPRSCLRRNPDGPSRSSRWVAWRRAREGGTGRRNGGGETGAERAPWTRTPRRKSGKWTRGRSWLARAEWDGFFKEFGGGPRFPRGLSQRHVEPPSEYAKDPRVQGAPAWLKHLQAILSPYDVVQGLRIPGSD